MTNNKYLKAEAQEQIREQLTNKIIYLLHRSSLEQLKEIKVFIENYV